MLVRLRRGEALENFHARLRCKDGSIRHVLVNSSACIQEGEFVYSRCFTRDVTPQRKMERALQKAVRRRDQFLTTLGHALQNPVAPIQSAVERMLLAGPRDELDADALDADHRSPVTPTGTAGQRLARLEPDHPRQTRAPHAARGLVGRRGDRRRNQPAVDRSRRPDTDGFTSPLADPARRRSRSFGPGLRQPAR